MRGDGNYIVGNVDDGDLSPSSRMSKGQMKFFSGLQSSLGTLSRISETEAENVGDSESYNVKLENGNVDNQFYSEHPFGSWKNSLPLSENLSGSKKELNGDKKLSGAQVLLYSRVLKCLYLSRFDVELSILYLFDTFLLTFVNIVRQNNQPTCVLC